MIDSGQLYVACKCNDCPLNGLCNTFVNDSVGRCLYCFKVLTISGSRHISTYSDLLSNTVGGICADPHRYLLVVLFICEGMQV